MAIKYSSAFLSCLSGDTKPTNVPTGFVAFETDTGALFRFTGTVWGSFLICLGGGGGIGYGPGCGGTVTQLTSKSTAVTLNKLSGTITTHNASLMNGAVVTFTVNDSLVAATDVPTVIHSSGGTIGAYLIVANTPAAGSFKVTIRNETTGSLGEALVLRFAVIRGSVT